MKDEVVLDIETQNTYQEVGSRDTKLLKVSLVGVYFYATDKYESYLESELPKLWPLLDRASRTIGYNIDGFDWPVLNNYYPGDIAKLPTLDLMDVIYKRLGYRPKLDDVAQATLGIGKSGNGLQAVEYFRTGDIEKLKQYCLQDVKVTKDVYDFGIKEGKVFVADKVGKKNEVLVDFGVKDVPTSSVNLTMGF